MKTDGRLLFERKGEGLVAKLLDQFPEFSVDPEQPPERGPTNCITWGSYGGQRVIYKTFVHPDRKERESFAMKHWAPTGLVPHLLAETDDVIAMSFIRGGPIASGDDGTVKPDLCKSGRSLGIGLRKLTSVQRAL